MSDRNPRVSQAMMPPVVAHPTEGRSAVAKGLTNLAAQGAELRVNQLTGQLTSSLEEATSEFVAKMDAEAGFDPLEGLPSGDRTAVQNLSEIQGRLMMASEQHPDRMSELKMRQERILRDYMKRYPHLVSHFQSASSGVLGYNPIGAELQSLQQSAQSRKDLREQWMEQVIASGERLRVPSHWRMTNPDMYYSAIQHGENAEYRLQTDLRNLALLNTEGETRAIQGKRMLRASMPAAMRTSIPDIMQAVEGLRAEAEQRNLDIARMSPEEIREAMSTGRLQAYSMQMRQSREDLISNLEQTYFANSNMSREDIAKELAPILMMWDYAIENSSDAKVAERLQHLVSARDAVFDLELPDDVARLGQLGKMFEWGINYAGAQFASELVTSATNLLNPIIAGLGGGKAPGGRTEDPVIEDPNGDIIPNPAASRNRLPLPSETLDSAVFGELSRGARSFVISAVSEAERSSDPRDEATYLFTAGNMITQYANAYHEQWERYTQLLDETDVYNWIDLIGSPGLRPVWLAYHKHNQPPGGVAASVERMMGAETGTAFAGIERHVAKSVGIEHRAPLTGETRLGSMLTVEWDEVRNRPSFVLDEEAFDQLSTYGYQKVGDTIPEDSRLSRLNWLNRLSPGTPLMRVKSDMRKAVDELNASQIAHHFGMLVRANANLSPNDVSYREVAERMVKEYSPQ